MDSDSSFAHQLSNALEDILEVACCASVTEARRHLGKPGGLCAVVTGNTLAHGSGLSVVAEARRIDPDVPCLALITELTPDDTREYLFAGVTAVARGRCAKESAGLVVEFLHHHLRAADRCTLAAGRLLGHRATRSNRQVACVAAMIGGASPTLIASELGISAKTVNTHLDRARVLAGTPTRARLAARGRRLSSEIFAGARSSIDEACRSTRPTD